MKGKVYKNVKIGKGLIIAEYSILGMPPRGKKAGELPLRIGAHCRIRPFSVIYAGSNIGRNFETGTCVSIREDNTIGDDVIVGTGSTLEYGNRIGDGVRIHSGCFLEMVEIEEAVFIGPRVVMINDPHPPCPRYRSCKGGVKVRKNAKIGAGSILLAGVSIGKNALVGSGSVVTRDVPHNAVVAGNPAKVIKYLDDLKCIKGFFKKPYDWERRKRKG